jgi:Flp pilus assembly protein TadD
MPTNSASPARLLIALLFASAAFGASSAARLQPDEKFESGRQAYEASDYSKAAQLLQEAASKNPQNAEIHLLLAKTYNEINQHDAAIASAEKAVALAPQSSVYH